MRIEFHSGFDTRCVCVCVCVCLYVRMLGNIMFVLSLKIIESRESNFQWILVPVYYRWKYTKCHHRLFWIVRGARIYIYIYIYIYIHTYIYIWHVHASKGSQKVMTLACGSNFALVIHTYIHIYTYIYIYACTWVCGVFVCVHDFVFVLSLRKA
jgi:hypothetical protein